MKSNMPLVSIITVVFNGEKYIEQTIKSVISQTYKNIEYIIIDGGSNDDTVNIVNKYRNYISNFVSEQDDGIYDAMNKGVKLSNGEWIGIVNSDDWLELDAVETVVRESKLDTDIMYGFLRIVKNENEAQIIRNSHLYLNEKMIQHPATFIKNTAYKRVGLYNTRFKYSADYDFMLRAQSNNLVFQQVNSVISNFRVDGASSTVAAMIDTLNVLTKNDIKVSFKKWLYVRILWLKSKICH